MILLFSLVWYRTWLFFIKVYGVNISDFGFMAFFIRIFVIRLVRTHYFVFLLIVEVIMIFFYWIIRFIIIIAVPSQIYIFFFIVIIVSGACVGISFLVIITRELSKDIERFYLKI